MFSPCSVASPETAIPPGLNRTSKVPFGKPRCLATCRNKVMLALRKRSLFSALYEHLPRKEAMFIVIPLSSPKDAPGFSFWHSDIVLRKRQRNEIRRLSLPCVHEQFVH